MKLSGNTVLITGATSGIGLGLAKRLQAEGNTVVVAGRRKALLDQIVTDHPGMAAVVLDVTEPASIERCVRTMASEHPKLNVLVNNAGIMEPEDLTGGFDPARAQATIETNLLGPIRMLGGLLPQLSDGREAAVVNVSSGLAFVPLPLTPTYNATKAAIHSYTEALRVQLRDTAIEVIELIPPGVQTDLMGQTDSPQAMPLEEFLDEVMELLRTQGDAPEVCVERVKPLRQAEANGSYEEMLAMLSAH